MAEGFFYGFNWVWFAFMVPGLVISLWASAKMKSTFNKYKNVRTLSGMSGAAMARRILDMNGLQNVPVEQVSGHLSDHYDPQKSVVRLSADTFGSMSVGAVGVAAHEVGHAIQHAQGYGPAKVRSVIVPVCNIGSSLSIPLIFIGFLMNVLGLVYAGIILFSLVVAFQLVTLPVEFNASKRAIQTLDSMGTISQEELTGVRKVLTAAALTYVAALLTSLLQLLYYITLAGRRRN